MKRLLAVLAVTTVIALFASGTASASGTAVPYSKWAKCPRSFKLRAFSDHFGGYGYFVNCTNRTIYVRADLKNGPDPTDRKLRPGQRGSWSDNPRVGGRTTFRRWKVCTGSRCA